MQIDLVEEIISEVRDRCDIITQNSIQKDKEMKNGRLRNMGNRLSPVIHPSLRRKWGN